MKPILFASWALAWLAACGSMAAPPLRDTGASPPSASTGPSPTSRPSAEAALAAPNAGNAEPTAAAGGQRARLVQVAVSKMTACALDAQGQVVCWGHPLGEPFGHPNIGFRRVDLTDVAVLGGGPSAMCAATADALHCWGLDAPLGRLGPGQGDLPAPGRRFDLAGVTAVSTGAGHGCALLRDGTVRCWGRTWLTVDGSVLGVAQTRNADPVDVPVRDVTQLAVGAEHTCVLDDQGAVRCWGENSCGQLGTGDLQDATSPTRVPGLVAEQITAGTASTCALTTQGRTLCWGCVDGLGVAGAGSEIWGSIRMRREIARTPGAVTAAPALTHLEHEGGTLCGIDAHQRVLCWGDNRVGLLGEGEGTSPVRPTPAAVAVAPVSSLSIGGDAACAIVHGESDSVTCWGYDRRGVMGEDGEENRFVRPRRLVPVPPEGVR